MAKKRYGPEEIISKLREADILIGQGKSPLVSLTLLRYKNLTSGGPYEQQALHRRVQRSFLRKAGIFSAKTGGLNR